jgi:hypothetical protein
MRMIYDSKLYRVHRTRKEARNDLEINIIEIKRREWNFISKDI